MSFFFNGRERKFDVKLRNSDDKIIFKDVIQTGLKFGQKSRRKVLVLKRSHGCGISSIIISGHIKRKLMLKKKY